MKVYMMNHIHMGQVRLEENFISIKDVQNLLDKNGKKPNVKKWVVYNISKEWSSKSGSPKKWRG